MQNRPASYLLIASTFLLIFLALFLGRAADDNSLFSWSWAFAATDTPRIYLLLIAGLIISFPLSQVQIPDEYQLPFLALLSFATCLPFYRESEIIIDASRYFTEAKHLELYGPGYFLREWGKAIPAWTDLPLIPFLYGLIFRLLGESRVFIQLFTTALFSATSVLTCLIGRSLWDRETGFAAGLLLLGIPYLLTQVPLMLVDVPTMFFLTLAVYAFIEALTKGGTARDAFAAAAVVLAILSKYSTWFMLSVLGVALIVFAVERAGSSASKQVIRTGMMILAVAAGVSAMLLLMQSGVVSEQIHLLREYQKPGLGRWGESFLSTFFFQTHPLVSLAALASLVVAIRSRDRKYAVVVWLLLLVVLFGIRRIRYTVPVFPMLALMAAYGLRVIKRKELRQYLLFGTIASSLVIAACAFLPFALRMSPENLKQAGAFLETLDTPKVEVVTVPPQDPVVNLAAAVPLLDLFTAKQIQFSYRPEGFPAKQEIEQSSLRFTWEYRNPTYYRTVSPVAENSILVLLSDLSGAPLPEAVSAKLENYRLVSSFHLNEKVFRYTIGISVYQKR